MIWCCEKFSVSERFSVQFRVVVDAYENTLNDLNLTVSTKDFADLGRTTV